MSVHKKTQIWLSNVTPRLPMMQISSVLTHFTTSDIVSAASICAARVNVLHTGRKMPFTLILCPLLWYF